MRTYWHVPKLWPGETAYVVGGGPSVTPEMLASLEGRRVVTVNMSYLATPWADILFFADLRWWDREWEERRDKLLGFKGIVATTSTHVADKAPSQRPVKLLKRMTPEDVRSGLALADDTVAMERTSLQGAMNLCYHLGVKRIALLGADNRDAPNGRIHWHGEYPWTRFNESWDIKGRQFGYCAQRLKGVGVEVINCSPVSTLPYWPIRDLADVIKEVDGERQA